MANLLVLTVLAAVCGYAGYSLIHKLRFGGGCCGEREAAPQRVKVTDRNKTHYPYKAMLRVDGMICSNCVRRVENALNSLPGVWVTRTDLSTGRITVRLQEPPKQEVLCHAVRKAGYLVLSVEESA